MGPHYYGISLYHSLPPMTKKEILLSVIVPMLATIFAFVLVVFVVFCYLSRKAKKQARLDAKDVQPSKKNNSNVAYAVDSTYDHRPANAEWLIWLILAVCSLILITLTVVLTLTAIMFHRARTWYPDLGPQLDYYNSNWSDSFRLQRHALDVATQQAPYLYPSGSATFWAPALKCQSANDSVIIDATHRFGRNTSSDSPEYTSYATWIPTDNQSLDTKRIFVMTNSGEVHTTIDDGAHGHLGIVNVTECLLGNASMTFNQADNVLTTSQWTLPFKYDKLTEKTAHELVSYAAVMNAFDEIIVGREETVVGTNNPSGFAFTPRHYLNIDWNRAEEVQKGLEGFFQNITISLLSDPSFAKTVTQ